MPGAVRIGDLCRWRAAREYKPRFSAGRRKRDEVYAKGGQAGKISGTHYANSIHLGRRKVSPSKSMRERWFELQISGLQTDSKIRLAGEVQPEFAAERTRDGSDCHLPRVDQVGLIGG